MLSVNITDSDDHFEQDFTLLFTWDNISEFYTWSQLAAGPIPTGLKNFNFNRFPGQVLNQGVTTGKEDEFLSVLRMEGVVNDTKRQEFYANGGGFQVFRLTPPANWSSLYISHSDKFPSFEKTMRQRWTGKPESTHNLTTV